MNWTFFPQWTRILSEMKGIEFLEAKNIDDDIFCAVKTGEKSYKGRGVTSMDFELAWSGTGLKEWG